MVVGQFESRYRRRHVIRWLRLLWPPRHTRHDHRVESWRSQAMHGMPSLRSRNTARSRRIRRRIREPLAREFLAREFDDLSEAPNPILDACGHSWSTRIWVGEALASCAAIWLCSSRAISSRLHGHGSSSMRFKTLRSRSRSSTSLGSGLGIGSSPSCAQGPGVGPPSGVGATLVYGAAETSQLAGKNQTDPLPVIALPVGRTEVAVCLGATSRRGCSSGPTSLLRRCLHSCVTHLISPGGSRCASPVGNEGPRRARNRTRRCR